MHSIAERGAFSIALSGGSLPSMLATLPETFANVIVDNNDNDDNDHAQFFSKWHVLLADERCVPETHNDSNLQSLRTQLFSKLGSAIPSSQIYGINQELLLSSSLSSSTTTSTTDAVAEDYHHTVQSVVTTYTGGQLDLAVLGFGPDGHTCSLFPNHVLLQEENDDDDTTTIWVAGLDDSPKPPPSRVTLTLPVLNRRTRHVLFCGTGSSKCSILQASFAKVIKQQAAKQADDDDSNNTKHYLVEMQKPPPFPCAMVQPNKVLSSSSSSSATSTPALQWFVDQEAMQGVTITTDSSS